MRVGRSSICASSPRRTPASGSSSTGRDRPCAGPRDPRRSGWGWRRFSIRRLPGTIPSSSRVTVTFMTTSATSRRRHGAAAPRFSSVRCRRTSGRVHRSHRSTPRGSPAIDLRNGIGSSSRDGNARPRGTCRGLSTRTSRLLRSTTDMRTWRSVGRGALKAWGGSKTPGKRMKGRVTSIPCGFAPTARSRRRSERRRRLLPIRGFISAI